jgi:type VI secretion system FHA domain protein
MVAPHEITAVGIEMLISDEAEIGEIQRVNKANAASLRLEDDSPRSAAAQPDATPRAAPHRAEAPAARRPDPAPPSAAPRRAEPPPVSAAARVAHHAPPPPAPKPAAPSASAVPRPGLAPLPAPSALLEPFFRGAGLPPQKLDDKQAGEILHRLGQLMREVVLGVTENLHLRSEQKNVLRVPTTTIQPQNNNPLKFSAGVEEALNDLLFRESAEYLSAVDAVRETFGDIKQHQQHLLGAVRTAVVDYVGRLDPEELESKISNGKSGALINAANKLKYWDLFKDLYQVVAQHQPGQFPHQFLEELARAYELEESRSVSPAAAARHAKLG